MLFDIARILLGGMFFVFGLNGFFRWWPLPKMNLEMTKLNEALMATKIIMPVVKVFEVVFGFLLLLNKFTFLATLALLPICFFIILAHMVFNRPKGFGMSAFIAIMMGILIWNHRYDFRDIYTPNSTRSTIQKLKDIF